MLLHVLMDARLEEQGSFPFLGLQIMVWLLVVCTASRPMRLLTYYQRASMAVSDF